MPFTDTQQRTTPAGESSPEASPVTRRLRLHVVWPEQRHRRLATTNLVSAAIIAMIGLSIVTGRAGGPVPAALVRAERSVHAGRIFESLVQSLMAARAEAEAMAVERAQAEQATPAAQPKRLPVGKGMWMWQVGQTEGGNVEAIVARAKHAGLTHIYVRTGSGPDGFYAGGFLNQILPVAHNAGLAVYGWDFPHFQNWQEDVHRALVTAAYVTPDGHRLDGFSADIETPSEGTHISPEVATAYGQALRQGVGNDYTLIATVPRPSAARAWFPYAQVVADFDAVAPMVYWLNREPGSDVLGAIRDLAPHGKPVFPVGQAYDGSAEGGRPGVPPPGELVRFMEVAAQNGVTGVSFWSWQAADQAAWDTIKDAKMFG